MSRNSSFWEGGEDMYRSQLAKEEKQKLDALRTKLKAEPQPELQATIKAEIAAVKKEYKEKRRGADYSLFARR